MSANEIHKDDIGIQFIGTVSNASAAIDISTATTKDFIFKKPGGTLLEKSTSFYTDGTDGVLIYTSVDGDLNEEGRWKLQSHVITPSSDFRTDIYDFRVYRNLEA